MFDTEDRPQKMNAFELINFTCGSVINKMFDRKGEGSYDTHFTSPKPPDEIVSRISDVLDSNNIHHESPHN